MQTKHKFQVGDKFTVFYFFGDKFTIDELVPEGYIAHRNDDPKPLAFIFEDHADMKPAS
jgi:hypothetical protein